MGEFGKMGADRGERCSNRQETYTSPCCYTDHASAVTKCEGCGAPLICEEEQVTEYVCRIPYEDEQEEE